MIKTVEAVSMALSEARAMLRSSTRTAAPCYVVELFQSQENPHTTNDLQWKEVFASDDPGECTEFIGNYMALAAIKAHNECLMEPSEEMTMAGYEATNNNCFCDECLTQIFQAMISTQETNSDQAKQRA